MQIFCSAPFGTVFVPFVLVHLKYCEASQPQAEGNVKFLGSTSQGTQSYAYYTKTPCKYLSYYLDCRRPCGLLTLLSPNDAQSDLGNFRASANFE